MKHLGLPENSTNAAGVIHGLEEQSLDRRIRRENKHPSTGADAQPFPNGPPQSGLGTGGEYRKPFDEIRTWEQFDADRGDDTAKEIREYYIPDFADWKNHDNYKREFDCLMDALKPEPELPKR